MKNSLWCIFGGCFLALASSTKGQISDPCTGDGILLTSSEGTLSTPNYPNDYDNNLSCKWTIEAPVNQSVEVYFYDVMLEVSSTTCRLDYLQIFDGEEQYTGSSFCGNIVPRNFLSNSSTVKIIFKSDDSITERGFSIGWKFVDRCLESEFTCWNGSCIPIGQHCNHVQNCEDNSDEIECAQPSQNFEECGKQDISPEFSWAPRIIGGNKAIPGSWPWQAQLVYSVSNASFCGGSIIRKRWILTAAHCVTHLSSSSLRIIVGRHEVSGSTDEQYFQVSRIIVHPKYNARDFESDIAVVQLATAIVYTRYVRRICIPSSYQPDLNLVPGTICIVTGFGDKDPTSSEVPSESIYQARLPIVSSDVCQKKYSISSLITERKLCAGALGLGGVDACQGDSGGLLSYLYGESTWYEIGITSYGKGCADPDFPGVYTRVSSFYDWIQQETIWDEACSTGVNLTTPSGSISLTFDNNSNSANCTWRVVASPGNVIHVSLKQQLFGATSCNSDSSNFIEIYDGNTLKHSICESESFLNFTSETNLVVSEFVHHNMLFPRRNFTLSWYFIAVPETTTQSETSTQVPTLNREEVTNSSISGREETTTNSGSKCTLTSPCILPILFLLFLKHCWFF